MEILKNAKWHKEPYLDLGEGYVGRMLPDGLSQITNGDKFGLIDLDGNMDIGFEQEHPFEKDRFIIFEDGFESGLISFDNEIIHPATADSIEYFEAEKLYALEIGNDTVFLKNDGSVLNTELPVRSVKNHEFKEGVLLCEFWTDKEKTNTAEGFMNPDGALLFKPQYTNSGDFNGGIAPVSDLNYDNPCYIDKKGKILFQAPRNWEGIFEFEGDLARIYVEEQGTAYINRNFEIVIEPQKFGSTSGMFSGLYPFSVELRKGAYNSDGEMIISPELGFTEIRDFTDTLIIVNQPKFKRKHKEPRKLWAWSNIIDQYGVFDFEAQKMIVSPIYDTIYTAGEDFVIVSDKNRKKGYFSAMGKQLTEIVLDDANDVYHKKSWVKSGSFWGVIRFD